MTMPSRGSYQGQDSFVIEALGGKRGGFFVDSGASDGLKGSNTYRLETEFGWSGICIEPNTELFSRLRANRRCNCLNCCLWDSAGPVEFLEGAGVYGGIVVAYDAAFRRFAEDQARSSPLARCGDKPTVKPAREIGEILQTSGAPKTIDYWSLDTEGSELAILKSFPFEQYAVGILSVEHNYLSVRHEIEAFLKTKGMIRVQELGIDDIYMAANVHRPPWRSRVWTRRRVV